MTYLVTTRRLFSNHVREFDNYVEAMTYMQASGGISFQIIKDC